MPEQQRQDELTAQLQGQIAALDQENATLRSQLATCKQSQQAQTVEVARLRASEERYQALIDTAGEGIWRFELEVPLPINLPLDEQVDHAYRHAYIAECNDVYARMYGYECASDIIGFRLEQIMPDTVYNREYLRSTFASGYRVVNGESHDEDRQGNVHFILNNFVSIVENGYLVRVWGTQRNITPLKQSEQALQERAAQLEETNHLLEARDRILEATASAANALLTLENFDDSVNTALQIIGKGLDTDRVAVLENFDNLSEQAYGYWQVLYEWDSPYAVSQFAHSEVSRISYEGLEDLYQLFSQGYVNGGLIDDDEIFEPLRVALKEIGAKSTYSVPIFVDGKFWGIVGFDDCREAKRRSPAELAVLKTAAACIGSAIQRERIQRAREKAERTVLLEREKAATERAAELAKANEALKRSLDSLATEPSLDKFLGQVLGAIADQFDSPLAEYWYHPEDTAYIGMMSWQGQVYSRDEIAALYPNHSGIVGHKVPPEQVHGESLQSRKQYFITEDWNTDPYTSYEQWYPERGFHKEINVPMVLAEECIGALVVRLPRGYQITTQQIELAQALAHQATLAVQLTRLAEEAKVAVIACEQEKAAQERAAELAKANEALARTSSRLAEQPDLSTFLGHIMLEAIAQVGADGGHLTLYDSQREIISTAVLVEDGKVVKTPPFPPEMPIEQVEFIQLIRDTRKLRYFDLETNFEQDAHLLWAGVGEHHKRQKHLAGIAIPLFAGDKFLGHFGLAFKHQKPISEQSAELLQALSHQASLAIQLTQLAEEAKLAAIAREQEKAATERAAELAKANHALQATIDTLGTLDSLDNFVPAALKIISRTFGTNSCAFFEHSVDNFIYLRYWALENHILHPKDLLELDREKFAFVRRLAEGAEVPIEYVGGVPLRARKDTLILNHITGTVVPEFDTFTQIHGWELELNLPLVLNDVAEAALCLYRSAEKPFTTNEIALAEALGKQLALALQSSRLAEEAKQVAIAREQEKATQERAAELAKANEVLRRTASQLVGQQNLSHFLNHVLLEVSQEIGAVCNAVFLYDRQSNALLMNSAVYGGQIIELNTDPRFELWRTPVSGNHNEGWEIVQSRGYAWHELEDDIVHGDELWDFSEAWHRKMQHRRVMSVFLQVGDEPLGFMGLCFRENVQLSTERVELVRALANQAALAIQLTRLAEEAKLAAIARAEEAKLAAILEERNRIACEIHDTLAQAFGGILMQLQAASYFFPTKPDNAQEHLVAARELANSGLAEARRSVWSLYQEGRQYQDLAHTVSQALKQLTSGTKVRANISIQGIPKSVAPNVGMNLLRIVQESVNNTLRHAQAQTIQITLSYAPNQVRLNVCDDGCGFEPQLPSQGFGLTSMHQRAEQIGALLQIISAVGAGTEIRVIMPFC